MDVTIVGTGRNERDSLLFHSDTLNEGIPTFTLVDKRYRSGFSSSSEVRVHMTMLNDDQLNAHIMSAEDHVEACHELLASRILARQREEDEIEDEIAKKEATVENPPREDRYAH
jgi:hypothetical protein